MAINGGSPRCFTLNGKASSCVPVAQFDFPFPCDPDQQRTEFPKDAGQEVIQTDGSRIVSQETKLRIRVNPNSLSYPFPLV